MSNLSEMFEHNSWANQRLLEHCATLPPEVLEQTVPGTYGSIIDTLRHIAGGEERYLCFLEDRPRRPQLMEKAGLDIARLLETALDRAERWRRLVAVEPDPLTVITRKRPDGSDDSVTTRTALVQAIHHGNDHRTHICTILGAQGRQAPVLDAWHFYGES